MGKEKELKASEKMDKDSKVPDPESNLPDTIPVEDIHQDTKTVETEEEKVKDIEWVAGQGHRMSKRCIVLYHMTLCNTRL